MDIGVGDVLCVRTGGWAGWFIRLGARLTGKPAGTNHVIIVHHQDQAGLWWGIEGRPGGIGDVQITQKMLASRWTVGNQAQPKTEEQRYLVALAAEQVKGTPYDWRTIADHLRDALNTAIFTWDRVIFWQREKDWPDGKVPAQMVCSSFADWAYEKVGLASPRESRTRMTTPGDWVKFIQDVGWRRLTAT